MGKISNFGIFLKNQGGVCYAGETLEGKVSFTLAGKIRVKAIYLHFHGYARVHWTEKQSYGMSRNVNRKVTKDYGAEEVYFSHTSEIFDSGGKDSVRFHPGEHSFPFEFLVPEKCPTSYEGSMGRVRYYIEAKVVTLFSCKICTIRGFTVIRRYNLNNDARAQEKVIAGNEMSLCCMCCRSEPIAVNLTLKKIGYVPGESIPFRIEISNKSRRKISSLEVELLMIVQYHSSKKSRTHQNVVASLTKKKIRKDKTTIWSDNKLVVPSIPNSFLEGCSLIDIGYVLQLSVCPSGPSFRLPVKIELIIGTEPIISGSPFQNTDRGEKDLKQTGMCRSLDEKSDSPVTQSSVQMTEVQPNFRECVIGQASLEEEIDHDNHEHVRFVPAYPCLLTTKFPDSFLVAPLSSIS